MAHTPPPAAQQWRAWARLAWASLAAVVVLALIAAAGNAVVPFVLGLVLAYLLLPLVNRLSKRMPRPLAIAVVYVLIALIMAGLALLIVPPLVSQARRLLGEVSNPANWSTIAQSAIAWYENTIPPELRAPTSGILQQLVAAVQANLSSILQTTGRFLLNQALGALSVVSFLFGLLVVPVWLFYVLSDARRARVTLNRLMHPRIRTDFWNLWTITDRTLNAYIRGQLTLGLIVGVAAWAGLFALDFVPGVEVDYILLLAIWAGVAELVPMVGALLGAIPAVLVALAVGGPLSAGAVTALFFVIQFVENNVLVPRVIGESVGIHPAILLVVIVIASQVLGFIGVVIAAPLAAIARDVYRYVWHRLNGQPASQALAAISAVTPGQAKVASPSS